MLRIRSARDVAMRKVSPPSASIGAPTARPGKTLTKIGRCNVAG
jgi:hypothetical protein